MSEPQTEAGKALLGYLNGDESGLGLIGVRRSDAIAAIEAEAREATIAELATAGPLIMSGEQAQAAERHLARMRAEAIAIGAREERERCIEALRREAQNALDSGIRPSGKELDAWNYVARHFLDSAAVILAEPEATPSDYDLDRNAAERDWLGRP